MALVQVQMQPGGRVIWAKESAAAKLVAQGKASYVVTVATAEPDATIEIVSPAQSLQPPKRGRR